MNNYYTQWILTALSLLLCISSSAQTADCECEDGNVTICYLPNSKYCVPGNGFGNPCGYTLDGSNMSDYLRRKLLNSDNFGLNGTVECPININALDDDISIAYIQDQECDIIFVGNFSTDTLTLATGGEFTSLPDNVLSPIREWSILCPTNLVITTQAEAALWGYVVENENENPNTPSPVSNDLNIFNGPFGDVPSFNQGGTYQGIITTGPSTGYTVLAVDRTFRPTAVIDSLTNDLIFGDIGIFCGGGAGSISFGEEVNNRNDRFTCNIFALGCSIAGSQDTQNEVALCAGDGYTLPSGLVVSDAGTYSDTLIASNFCDSIITTKLSYLDTLSSVVTHNGCNGDGFEVSIGGIDYNENNQTGRETLIASNGCDSIVTIELAFSEATSSIFQERICEGDNTEFIVGTEVFGKDNLTGSVMLNSSTGCDSIVDVSITLEANFMETEMYQRCDDESLIVRDREYSGTIIDTFFYTNESGCDSLYVVNIETYELIPAPQIQNPINLIINEDFEISVPLEDEYSISWEPADFVSCSTCATTTLLSDGSIDLLSYTITDEKLCSRSFDINLLYVCPLYLPNIISPHDQGSTNASFGPLSNSGCDISDGYEMNIYDRWGELMFFSDDPETSWDGYYNNNLVSRGVYVYYISFAQNGATVKKSGDITVI